MQSLAGQFRTVQPSRAPSAAPTLHAAPRVVADPAPSRWGYKIHRWLLSPLFRAALRIGLPAFVLAFLVLSFLSNDAALGRFHAMITDAQTAVAARPEYQITGIEIYGASPALQAEIVETLDLSLPLSGLDVDLDQKRSALLDIASVETAHLQLSAGGIITATVSEKPAVALWRGPDGLVQIGADGAALRPVAYRADALDLPLLAGEGAAQQLDSLALIAAETGGIADAIRGFVWVGDRRWDIVLSGDRTISLPERDPVTALRRLLVLDQSRGLLDRDISVVDFRNPHRPTIRLKARAVAALRAARGHSIEGFSQ